MSGGVLGVVLTGGESRRYGRPKWRVPVAGTPMGRRAVDALRDAAGTVAAVGGGEEVATELEVEALADLRPGRGPLGGLHTALVTARERGKESVLLLGCDLPLVSGAALRALLSRAPGGRPVVPEGPSGVEPLCALYPVGLLEWVEEALDGEDLSLRALVERGETLRVPVEVLERAAGRTELLLNVNRPAERMRAEALLCDGPPLLCVVGWKNSGKTTFTVGLAAELADRGRRVMTVKHGHGFDLDRPGTDSWRHRHEGRAVRVALAGPEGMAVLGGWGPGGEPPLREIANRYLGEADVVLAEGWKAGPDPKVEVHRCAAHPDPIHRRGSPLADTFLALVTDRVDCGSEVPVFPWGEPREACAGVADLVERVLLP